MDFTPRPGGYIRFPLNIFTTRPALTEKKFILLLHLFFYALIHVDHHLPLASIFLVLLWSASVHVHIRRWQRHGITLIRRHWSQWTLQIPGQGPCQLTRIQVGYIGRLGIQLCVYGNTQRTSIWLWPDALSAAQYQSLRYYLATERMDVRSVRER